MYIAYMHTYMSALRKILLSTEEIFTLVWINAVSDYSCSTVSRITELSMKDIYVLSMWMAHSHYDKWALFRTQWSPCWVYWTKCSILLCKVIGPISASKSLKKSTGEKIFSIKRVKLFATCCPLTDFILLQTEPSWTLHGNESIVLARLILKPCGSWCYQLMYNSFLFKEQNSDLINFHWVFLKQADAGQDFFWD